MINETDRVRNEKAVIAAANMLIKLPLNITSRTVAGVDYMSGEIQAVQPDVGVRAAG